MRPIDECLRAADIAAKVRQALIDEPELRGNLLSAGRTTELPEMVRELVEEVRRLENGIIHGVEIPAHLREERGA